MSDSSGTSDLNLVVPRQARFESAVQMTKKLQRGNSLENARSAQEVTQFGSSANLDNSAQPGSFTTDDVNDIYVNVREPEPIIKLEESEEEDYEPRNFDSEISITGFIKEDPRTPEHRIKAPSSPAVRGRRIKCNQSKLMPNYPSSAKD